MRAYLAVLVLIFGGMVAAAAVFFDPTEPRQTGSSQDGRRAVEQAGDGIDQTGPEEIDRLHVLLEQRDAKISELEMWLEEMPHLLASVEEREVRIQDLEAQLEQGLDPSGSEEIGRLRILLQHQEAEINALHAVLEEIPHGPAAVDEREAGLGQPEAQPDQGADGIDWSGSEEITRLRVLLRVRETEIEALQSQLEEIPHLLTAIDEREARIEQLEAQLVKPVGPAQAEP